ncbi:hypothetical protein FRACYDRAFT_249578 [Fragilariopsis cylindrus CCMP1102]|uniref:Pseudouridine synthase RsuA/RluA-like domain-containing protein n=1 Tax=Fragilariopsis cylindrus CCMP1102 TaxID=635003 RepID=A0A1E7ES57_9STRA|nr:hypothetical protein FRACYDRAFT_249578 [Fragilariopsis cylindrus CCMP1102]|eukprot:OEU08677.1 hypothetical protein FRACYDRAFT_249578 [Fragilariopsis cylindrus CCMP1102]
MNTTLPAAAAASEVRSSASVRPSTATLKLNQGRIYDCGRVPPIPKQKQKQQQQQQQFRRESSSDKDEDPAVDSKHHDGDEDGDDNYNTSSLLRYLISSHTNKRRGSFSKSGWLRRIIRGQIRIKIENGSTSIIMTNPSYKILTKENVKQQVEYYRRPWYEPIIQDKVALLDDVDTYYEYSVLNTFRRLYNNNHDNDNDIDNNRNRPCKNNSVTMSSEDDDDDDDDDDMNMNKNVKELIQKYCSAPPQPVHRLGVGTSGILLIATSFIGRQKLTKSIRSKTEMSSKNKNRSSDCCRKIYRALVYAYRNDNRSSLSSSSSSNNNDSNDNNDTTTIKKILIPDLMTIDCPIGPTPFPIGGGTIHAACPSNTTTFNTKEKDDEEEEESLSSLLYGHVHVHKNDNAFHDDDHDPDGGDSAADNNNDNVDVNQAKIENKNIKSALSYVKVIRRNINISLTNTENGNNDDNDKVNDNDGYDHHHKSSSSSSKLLLDNTALVEIEIPTGRPHQIRIHMSYAGYALVDDPLYLPGGIPSHEKKQFPVRKKEDEDIETDIEEEEEEEEEEGEHTSDKTTTSSRVPLPRDCGYHLHAYQISIENPSFLSSKKHTNATSVDHDGQDNGNDNDSKSATATTTTTTKEKKMRMMTFTAPPPAILR